jgi:toxin ParE1/3/4
MRPRVDLSDRARQDLDEMWEWLAVQNEEAANQLLMLLADKFLLLGDNPLLGKSRSEFWLELRSFVVKPYVIFYQPFDDGVEIVRVLHSARDVDSELLPTFG